MSPFFIYFNVKGWSNIWPLWIEPPILLHSTDQWRSSPACDHPSTESKWVLHPRNWKFFLWFFTPSACSKGKYAEEGFGGNYVSTNINQIVIPPWYPARLRRGVLIFYRTGPCFF